MQISKEKKIKVALMSYSMDNRRSKGTAQYARKLIENILADKLFDFYLVHYDKVDDPLYDRAKEIIMPKIKLPCCSHFISQMLFFWQYRKNKFDIIHWFQPRVYPFYWLAPSKKIIITLHGAGEYTANRKRFYYNEVFKFILTYLNKRVDMVIADSKHGSEEIVKYYKMKREKVKAIYLGGGEIYKPLDKKITKQLIAREYKVNAPFILDIARLTPHKNINSLIKAYNIYRDKYLRKEKLVIVGSPTLDYQETYDLAKNSKYKNDIHFINFVKQKDLNAMYSAADLFVFPSLDEGFGLPVIEAMASGTPVITSDIMSLPEVAGKAAILINPLDTEGLAEAMNKVLTDENLRQDLIGRGLIQSQKFNWTETAKQTKEIYLKLLKNMS